MVFHSIDFAFFLPIVFIVYWTLQKYLRAQNAFIILASAVFYGWWEPYLLLLIAASSLLDYCVGLAIAKTEKSWQRRSLLLLSMLGNLGMLAVFKYFNFFLQSFVTAFSWFGQELVLDKWDIILPVGISFYTFQTMSYTIDVYRKGLSPTRDLLAFAAFVGFFPQLVAGPIERANNLLPQFFTHRHFNYANAADGLRQMLWGFAKKILVADTCAEYANIIFNNSADYGGSTLWLGALFFAFQIYGDFSGYSDIAIGCSRLFGFNLQRNFAFPYFSRDIAEFWRRWHISLSSWFKDYLYFPLGGSRGGKWLALRNTSIIFLVSGFWHGSNWTFIAWGAINGLYFIPLLLFSRNRQNLDTVANGRLLPSLREIWQMLNTFILVLIAWVLFRADTIAQALGMYKQMFSASVFQMPAIIEPATGLPILPKKLLLFLFVFMLIEWFCRQQQHVLEGLKHSPTWLRWLIYWVLAQLILLFSGVNSSFIYFQF